MLTALIVDDSRTVRMILGRIMKEIGFQVREAGNGREALERLVESGKPDLILVDWNMPEMGGYDFLVEFRAQPANAGVPVMMVTTEAEIEQVTKALEAGANEYVMKPFTRDIIVDKLALLGFSLN
jgi:two-component system chemotaxis response regulator CheY